jgi:hypothetical protein
MFCPAFRADRNANAVEMRTIGGNSIYGSFPTDYACFRAMSKQLEDIDSELAA